MAPYTMSPVGFGAVCDINNGFIICCTAATTHGPTFLTPLFSLFLSHTHCYFPLFHIFSLFAITVHPVIQVPNQLVGAPLGTDVQIECHVEASPKSINYWIKDTGECVHLSHSLYIGVCVCVCVMFRLVKRKASQVFHFIDSWRHIGQLYTYINHARYTQCIWFDVLWHCH